MSEEDFLSVIQDEFLQESMDALGRVEALSLALEKNPDSEKIYVELARLGHNMKGAGKAVGFEHVAKIGHHLEDFILAIKNKIVPASPANLDFLFKCLDQLKAFIAILIEDRTSAINHERLVSDIVNRLAGAHRPEEVSPVAMIDLSNFDPAAIKAEVEKKAQDQKNAANTTVVESKTHNTDSIAVAVKESPKENIKETSKPNLTEVAKESVKEVVKEQTQAEPPKSTQTEVLRIQKPKIDYLLDAFGEQVILQTTLEQYKFDLEANKELVLKTISQLTKLTFELQSHALSLTMVQLNPTFTKLERAIRDAARTCNKNIQINLIGGDTEIDKTLIDSLSDSLTHMVRNSVDHAVEETEVRLQKGKPAHGTVSISAQRVGGQLWLEISDDGKGLNPQMIRDKAVSKGIITQAVADKMTVQESYHLIFASGFSTKDTVSEISGRGVGMNVVQEAVQNLKGAIEIQSEIDVGTTFRLKVPLSLAIFNGTVIEVGDFKFVVPNSEITEIGKISMADHIRVGNSSSAIQIRDEIYELIDLREKLSSLKSIHDFKESKKAERPVLISKKYGNKAFLVDSIVGMQKVVQKPLGDEIKSKPEYAAGTILGDGSPGVILNLHVFANYG